jgi:predicted ribosomally synthesized peptide with SipW-like signal peptide
MSTTKRRKSAKETRVLVASIITAAAIIAGSTFAWFSSSDEVTNRLSTTADYGVTIAEDFTPPYNWLPGQEVDKNVAVVNTGNVDAFVRTWLEGEMNLYTEKTSATSVDAFGDLDLTDTTDPELIEMGLTKYTEVNGKRVYFKQLSTDIPEVPAGDTESTKTNYSEVMAVQAGGHLAAATGSFEFILNQGAEYEAPDGTTTQFDDGATVKSDDINADLWGLTENVSEGAGVDIDSDTFKPTSEGLFIFRRLINATASEETPDAFEYEYSGYYFDGENYFALQYKAVQEDVDGTPLANSSANSDYVLDPSYITTKFIDGEEDSISSVDHIELNDLMMFEAEQLILTNADLTWKYYSTAQGDPIVDYVYSVKKNHAGTKYYYIREKDGETTYWLDSAFTSPIAELPGDLVDVSGPTKVYFDQEEAPEVPTLVASYTNPYTKQDISIKIELGKTVDTEEAEGWTMFTKTGDDDKEYYTFYYNNDLEEGDTTARLVDNVTLSKNTVKDAYLAFDFDLNVKMDSIQIAINADGQEDFDSVKEGWATGNAFVTEASAEEEVGAPEIETITWEAAEESNP